MYKKKLKYCMIIPVIFIILFISACSPAPNLSFTEKITVEYTTQDENLKFEITDSNDIKEIIKACTENAQNGDGNCGFDVIKLIFEGNDKKITLLPAGDNCDTMKYGDLNYDKYYLIGDENKAKLISLLQKYGASFDYLENDETE